MSQSHGTTFELVLLAISKWKESVKNRLYNYNTKLISIHKKTYSTLFKLKEKQLFKSHLFIAQYAGGEGIDQVLPTDNLQICSGFRLNSFVLVLDCLNFLSTTLNCSSLFTRRSLASALASCKTYFFLEVSLFSIFSA